MIQKSLFDETFGYILMCSVVLLGIKVKFFESQ